MAVVPRKYKSKTTFYAVNEWRGKQVAEKIGPNERQARIRDNAMKKEIKTGTYKPPSEVIAKRVGDFIEEWAAPRINAYANDERRLIRLYVEPRAWLTDRRVDEIEPTDTDRLVAELRAEKKPNGLRRLSDKTISNLLGVLTLVFDAAVRAKLTTINPITLPPNTLKRRPTTEKEIYSPGEFAVLTRHHSIPWPIRVMNALCLYTGMRMGEACGRRWRDLEEAPSLHALFVRDQYNGKPLKTENPRVVPVHPELAALLTVWADEGFELYTGARPTPEDFIVPNISARASSRNHTRSSYYKAFVKHAEAAGVRPRSVHATRHTFISLTQRCGAQKANVERVTHNAQGDIVDRYTHLWIPLCEAVACLNLDVLPDVRPTTKNGGDSGGARSPFLSKKSLELGTTAAETRGSIPGASTIKRLENSHSAEALQEFAQEFPGASADLRGANRRRKRRLLAFKEVDPKAAAPGLAMCRALDAAYNGDQATVEAELARAALVLGGGK
jgi:integrase